MQEQDRARIMRTFAILLAGMALWAPARATTLEQLSMNDMIVKSTSIVHAKVTGSYSAPRGQQIFTFYQLQVSETLKTSAVSPGGAQLEVAVPGGAIRGLRQIVPGAPSLTLGADYVLFLWTGRAGPVQLIGLSQGLFRMTQDTAGNALLVRPAAMELVLDKNGNTVSNPALTLRWTDVRSQIRKVVGGN